MNEFRFEHLRNRGRMKLPRPVIYVGVAIILLAFFSVKWFQRSPDAAPQEPEDRPQVITPADAPEPMEETSEGILSLDGTGQRILPPRRISGERPVIPESLLRGDTLASPRIYVRVGTDGLVTELKLVSSSGSGEVDRLVLDALGEYTFHPAMSLGRPVAFSSVIAVPLRAPEEGSP